MSGITLTMKVLEDLTGCQNKKLLAMTDLDLSGNMVKHLVSGVFSEFKNLTRLNLSNNSLKTFPNEVAAELSNLKYLDISENNFSNLEFLDQLCNLEELFCNNNDLEISQKLVAAFICNKLNKIDGRGIENYKNISKTYKEKLTDIVSQIWSEHFDHVDLAKSTADDITFEVRNKLLKLIRIAKPSVPGLPSTVKDLLIKLFCDQFLKKLLSNKFSNAVLKNQTPVKKIRIKITDKVPVIISSPLRSPARSIVSPANIVESPRRSCLTSPKNNINSSYINTSASVTTPNKVRKVLNFENNDSKLANKSLQETSLTSPFKEKLSLEDAIDLMKVNKATSRKVVSPRSLTKKPETSRTSPRKSLNSAKYLFGSSPLKSPTRSLANTENIIGGLKRKLTSPKNNDSSNMSTTPHKLSHTQNDEVLKNSPAYSGQSSRRSDVHMGNSLLSPTKQAVDCIKKLNFNSNVSSAHSSKTFDDLDTTEYQPMHFLRCHSGDKRALKEGHTLDDPTDELTNVWGCSMEPDPHDPAKTTGIVATCGGTMVCLIDCSSGQVVKRFEHHKEQFFCLAWTTVELNNEPNNILAVSGHNGNLKLLHPRLLACFEEFGSGRPNRQLAVFLTNPASLVTNIFVHQTSGLLIGGTTGGVMAWSLGKNLNVSDIASNKRRNPCKVLSINNKMKGKMSTCDGLTPINDNFFACKFLSHGCIYVYNVNHLDHGPAYKLDWLKTNSEFIGLSCVNGLLLCGSDDGSIWMYNTSHLQNAGNKLIPKVLQWPDCKVDMENSNDAKMTDVLDKPTVLVINNLTSSHERTYIVAVTDCNLVCIWKRT
ncbi:hypothetical protein HELRODRAFT_190818 [Helobdella robusta]|uniref:Leucine-rich repeat and WD repeat-containing protein 1 n=1 Tax=Helobdella robusta TaxID=6412 RepID=T1FSB5_HELRO|nr:hypothetical protein HELRODRAFT_190818 [Helobdella robusta]ESO07939.1 hypothetical protein HELRODRAFT_190818 [Helobdella robusta]